MARIRDMRPRKPANRGLAPGLYCDPKKTRGGVVDYYSYKHPVTGVISYWGTDRKQAIYHAKQFNALIDRLPANVTVRVELVRKNPVPFFIYTNPHTQKITEWGHQSEQDVVDAANKLNTQLGSCLLARPWNDVLDAFEKDYPKWQVWADRTAAEHKTRLKKIKNAVGEADFVTYPLVKLNDLINTEFSGDGRIKIRTLLIDVYRYAMSKGWIDDNLAEKVLPPVAQKRKRERLTIEMYKGIHEAAPEWMRCAMDMSLKTLQALNEIITMRLSDADLKTMQLKVVRQKSKKHDSAYVAIQIDEELKAIIDRCRQLPVIGHTMIRRRSQSNNQKRGERGKVTKKVFEQTFAKAREDSKLFIGWDKARLPTFHEVKSLGGRMLKAQLIEQGLSEADAELLVKQLMCHRDVKTTQLYLDDGKPRHTKVIAPLRMNDI